MGWGEWLGLLAIAWMFSFYLYVSLMCFIFQLTLFF